MAAGDPHTSEFGCVLVQKGLVATPEEPLTNLDDAKRPIDWFTLTDWALHHAPGAEEWQKFRKVFDDSAMEFRALFLRQWWGTHEQSLENAARVANASRLLRGHWSAYDDIRQVSADINPILNHLWKGTPLP
jgi:hypothetical protein